MPAPIPAVRLRPYGVQDLELLSALLGDPETMCHLGGPESAEQIAARHQRYLEADAEKNGLYVIVGGEPEAAAGWVGFWESEWDGELVWECGWHVLPAFQGVGVATRAAGLVLEAAAARGKRRFADAFPSVDNAASNGLCRRVGFVALGEVEVEYPKGHVMRSFHWRFDLGRWIDETAASLWARG